MKLFFSISLALLMSASAAFATDAPTATKPATRTATKKKKAPAAKPQVETPAPTPAPPPPPPTLAQQSPVAPQVNFNNGQLFINAPNSSLVDVLNAVRHATGMTIDGVGTATERVVVRLGPGRPRDVLASLLNGSHYDYVILGSPNGQSVERMVLIARQGGAVDSSPQPTSAAAAQYPPAATRGIHMPPQPQVANTEDTGDDETNYDRDSAGDAGAEQPIQAQPPEQQGQPAPPEMPAYNPPPNQATPQDQQNPQGQANPNGPKTPEQLYQDLQNLERQRQQQNQSNPPQQQQSPQ